MAKECIRYCRIKDPGKSCEYDCRRIFITERDEGDFTFGPIHMIRAGIASQS